MNKEAHIVRKKGNRLTTLKKQAYLQIMVMPAVICLIIFSYFPMYGVQIAFKDFQINKGIWASPWVGFKHFVEFIMDPNIPAALLNTVGISATTLILSFPMSILFAIGINELTNKHYKKVVQTISYMPHFISWVILSVMAHSWLSPSTGFINALLVNTGILKEPFFFLGNENAFWPLAAVLSTWKGLGWSSIIYLSVIVGINPELYESATIDGANIIQRARYITIPGIMPTVMILLILSVGGLVKGNFDISYLLGNTLNSTRSQIIDTYVLKVGMKLGRYSYASAVGLLSGLVSMLLVIGANKLSKILTDESLF